ncbi:MAG: FGGY family carbohydrate kinase [Pirellulaceae bacterium]|nr:FGGY family carbohydrate kinase [Pirellulaceae bacterium]
MFYAGLDVGSTFLKGGVLDLAGRCVRQTVRRASPNFLSAACPGAREVDPERMATLASELLGDLLAVEPRIEGVLLSGQMHGLVLVSPSGSALRPAITWQDTRTLQSGAGKSAYELLQERLDPVVSEEIGREIGPGHPATQLWQFGLRGELPCGAAPLSIGDFIAVRLTGAAPVTHPTNASAHGLYSLPAGDWHHELIANLGLQTLSWPAIVPEGTIVGHWRGQGRSLPVFVPLGDQQAALLGVDLRDDELSLNIATGSQISCRSNSWRSTGSQVRPLLAGTYLHTLTHLPAGRALARLLGLFVEPLVRLGQVPPEAEIWSLLDSLARNAAPDNLLVDLSFFPCRTGQMGSFTHIQESSLNWGCIFSAALKAMAENYWTFAARLDPARPWKEVAYSGGLVQKLPLLRERITARFRCRDRVAENSEDALSGLLVYALHHAGLNPGSAWNKHPQRNGT